MFMVLGFRILRVEVTFGYDLNRQTVQGTSTGELFKVTIYIGGALGESPRPPPKLQNPPQPLLNPKPYVLP